MRGLMQQDEIVIQRQVRTGDKTAYSQVGTGFAHIAPMTEEQSSVNGIQFGKGFQLFCDLDTGIQESDKIISGGVTYTVRGVAYHSKGPHKFIKAILIDKIVTA